jgi:hypothetical protein
MPPSILETISMILAAQPAPPLPIFANEEIPDEITIVENGHCVANSHDLWAAMLLTHLKEPKTKEQIEAKQEQQSGFVSQLLNELKAIHELNDVSSDVKEVVFAFYHSYRLFALILTSRSTGESVLRVLCVHAVCFVFQFRILFRFPHPHRYPLTFRHSTPHSNSIGAISNKTNLLFAPYNHVCRDDHVHVAASHHAAAQDIIYGVLKCDGEGREKRKSEDFRQFSYQSLVTRQHIRVMESC